MIENAESENLTLAEMQFDSLLSATDSIKINFLHAGMGILDILGKQKKMKRIQEEQSEETKSQLCAYQQFEALNFCKDFKKKTASKKDYQLDLVKLFIQDQFVRGSLMTHLLDRYNLKKEDVIPQNAWELSDATVRAQLKLLFSKHGFPTKSEVGSDGMDAVFFIIQHADDDVEWRREQFPKIEMAVKNGDLDLQSYAYLHDRINMGLGKPQRFGSQIRKTNLETQTVELYPCEDVENLNKRRREYGMMPIELYKRYHLKMMVKAKN